MMTIYSYRAILGDGHTSHIAIQPHIRLRSMNPAWAPFMISTAGLDGPHIRLRSKHLAWAAFMIRP